ncbi:MAG: magnesium transporter [Candidatus Hydrogenedentes bacterium]|nr:magnesium transporter [Candidatus Hydrogenedentota bacterium]
MPDTQLQPWEIIREFIANKNAQELVDYLDNLPPGDTARAFSRLGEEECNRVLLLLEPEDAADIIEEMADAQGADIIEDLPIDEAASIIEEMESDRRADILAELDEDDAEAILRQMDPEEAKDARDLLKHNPDTAGGIMVTEFFAYPEDATVATVQSDLHKRSEQQSDSGVQYVYVESSRHALLGVLRLRDLFFAPLNTPIKSIMIANPIFVFTNTTLEELDDIFERYPFWGLPVVDESGVLQGVVRQADVVEAWGEQQGRTLLRFGGIVFGEEFRNMPLFERSSRRLSWLFLNMLLSMLAASVVLGHQETINRLFILVFFMPIVCNMSGCSGNQAVAVSIRELTLGIIKPEDYWHVWVKEVQIGFINGTILGTTLGLVASFFSKDATVVGLVVGGAFALNTLVAVSLGGLIPLALRKLKIDPALGAPPMLTTLTDMCGFFLVLGFARIAISVGLV